MAGDENTPATETASRLSDLEEKVRHLETKLSSIQEIGMALGSTLNLDRLLELIMQKITQLMNADRSTLYLLDEETGELWSKIAQGSEIKEIRLKIGSGIAGWVAQTGKTLNIKDAYKDERFNQDFDRRSGYRTRSILCQPMRNYQRKIIGVVQVLNKQSGYFTMEDENLLNALSSQAAVSIENSKLYLSVVAKNIELLDTQEKLRQKIAILDTLFLIEKEITESEGEKQLLDAIMGQSLSVIPSKSGAILIDDRLHVYERSRGEIAPTKTLRITIDEGILGHLLDTGEPLLANAVAELPYCTGDLDQRLGGESKTLVAVPMIADNQVIGAFILRNKQRGEHYNDDDLHVVTLLAGQTARAVQQRRMRDEKEKAERLATIGQMLSGVLHDFKTPMSIISGYVQLMSRETDEAMRDEYTSAILKQFDHLNVMTRELLAFARGESTLLLRKVFLNKFIDDMTELLTQEFREQQIELIVDAKYRGAIRMDENKMKRVFYNIARNAREAMTAGGSFRITVEQIENDVHFRFTDSGNGIPREIQDNLFDEFVSKGKKHGTGLGLAIVKKIVEAHKGQISFETTAEVGTTFDVKIPLQG